MNGPSKTLKERVRADNYPVTDRSVDFQIVGIKKTWSLNSSKGVMERKKNNI